MDFSKVGVEKREPLVCIPGPYAISAFADIDLKTIKDAKWITLLKTVYTDADGKSRTWESMERLTRPMNSELDAVGIVAILEKETGPELLLQKQFRPPIGKVCIEIPAGLIDEGETAEACAIRELREETGYVGKAIAGDAQSPVMYNDPGVCNTNLRIVRLAIDMTAAENQNPKPLLEEDEFIEAFSVQLTKLYTECQNLECQGFAIDARVGTIAEGIELAKLWKFS